MSLNRFFESIAPVLLGASSAQERASALQVDARRLAIYERFCRSHRFEAIESIFPHCCAAVPAAEWPALVEAYFRRHPMQHVELNTNAAKWPEFLASEVASRALPGWLPELADFEWWEWQTIIAPNESDDGASGPLRIASSVELRPYQYDFIDWIENDRSGEPAAAQTFVLFWLDPDLTLRREKASQVELLLLKSVATGEALTKPLLKELGVSQQEINATLLDLREAGILRGA
jgi:hypothetical protein